MAYSCDSSNEESVKELVAATIETYSKLDIVIHERSGEKVILVGWSRGAVRPGCLALDT